MTDVYYRTLVAGTGIGLQGAGITAAGIGTYTTIVEPADPSNGSRYINPYTRDFELDPSTLQLAQMPGTRQLVLLALATIQGSSTALPSLGVKMPSKIGASFVADVTASVRSALAHLTREDDPVIALESVKVERANVPGRGIVTVSYTDLASGETDEVNV